MPNTKLSNLGVVTIGNKKKANIVDVYMRSSLLPLCGVFFMPTSCLL